ncbi:NAD(P)-binding protein [Aspergillus homomorphus CBS 101889]|uniref:NAD(P)-binding protein n=1 Tax=Aspergillus homomorphus (strain CBS 101889) TaxID=1450537 RepID=A0A395IE85_ASPHC|nr:NAD(P)-binding protein [Aspergillus homomorphus CBS 101889]RAL17468.1 NAD(P)-binding protein [Aspergillus homomorphus CBS 101889]
MAPPVLLTGATGLIGFRVLQELLRNNYRVRITARSANKVQSVTTHPLIRPFESQLTTALIPDINAANAFDEALKDVTYVIHTGSPVPIPGTDPLRDVWSPTVDGTASLLTSALRFSTIKRIVLTSSIVATIPLSPLPPSTAPEVPVSITASSRVPLPANTTATPDVFETYVLAKTIALSNADTFMKTQNPDFTLAHVIPGYVLGRDERVHDAEMAAHMPSSCGILLQGLTGIDVLVPLHGGFVHVDDLAEMFLRVMELETEVQMESFGACVPVDFG